MGDLKSAGTSERDRILAPVPLLADHLLDDFDCGRPVLDEWLKSKAHKSEGRSARTYVACIGDTVVGYYCFATGSVRMDEVPGRLRRNMPTMIPVIVLGRLAVDGNHQGRGIGKGLMKDALLRALQASRIIGARAMMVHALDEDAARFYLGFGFIAFPDAGRTLFLPMETISAAIVV